MKLHFKLSDKEGLQRLQEDWLISFYEFFEERVIFTSSQTVFLALLDPHVMRPHEHSRVFLFAHNKGEKLRTFESSISVGLLRGKTISKIKHAPPFTFAVKSGESMCVEFPLKGDNTPKGKYKISIRVRNCGERVKQFAEKFSICSISDLVSLITGTGAGGVLTGWALNKLKNRKVHVSRADVLYLGTSTGAQHVGEAAGVAIRDRMGIADKIDAMTNRNAWETPVGTAFSGIADGVLSEIFDTSSPSLTLTVV